ncbi:spore germination protein (amino acid permease) [Lentibacillus halodurans]|uniref:Spore germination protein (Amino acid permease) n=1 Tax=Lentibacillus halodurans TaxID=237679 RepID=A0A1I0WB77_9BACI|nr:GerAB/ArcD/ProY family transporter [Lentibacillus halodurans]SFA85528.1 spore germination protein (amino acid permease) [Lentibacillus halodurans]
MVSIKDKVQQLMVLFLIAASQIGVGVLGFQSIINKYAGHDAWMSVIVAGVSVSVIIWLMYKMLQHDEKGDIVAIHQFTFGKWLGGLFSIIVTLYFLLMTVVVLRTYIEIIQVWMFPHLKVWAFLLLLLPLVYYTISDQFRTVVGVCFLGVVYPAFLIFVLVFPLQYADITHILPIMDHSFKEIIQSSSLAILDFMGFSTLLVFYPFIREAKQSQKYAQYGNLYSTLLYVTICLIAYVYYNQSELEEVIWATLGLWKIIEMPFMERFEYFGIATLFFSILPNVVLYMWSSVRMLNRTFGFEHKKVAAFLSAVLFIACVIFRGREGVNILNDVTGRIGLIFLFIYIPVLFVIHFIRRKVQKNGSS